MSPRLTRRAASRMAAIAVAGTLTSALLLACTSPEASHGMDDSASAPDEVVSGDSRPLWYERTRPLDLTGDGQSDSVRLIALGARADSLQLTLSFVVGGQEKHREHWHSSYEMALWDSASRTDTMLRARLDSLLDGVRVRRMGEPGVQLMAEDSALLAAVQPQPTHLISFAYGYESMVRLVWDASREQFVPLWSCC
jgi:hypothetical protein